MRDLFDWLFSGRGFFFLIIFGSWIVSSIGSAMQKAAKKAAEQQARKQHTQEQQPPQVPGQMSRMDSAKGQMAAMPSSKAEARPRPVAPRTVAKAPGEEEIAREIRRLMGMEPVSSLQQEARPQPRPTEPRRDSAIPPPSTVRKHSASGHLAEEMARRDKELEHFGILRDREEGVGQRIADRRFETALTRRFDQKAPKKAVARGRRRLDRALDLSRPASMFLAAEVFGQPRAIKGWQ